MVSISEESIKRVMLQFGNELIMRKIQSHYTATIARRFGNVRKGLELARLKKKRSLVNGYVAKPANTTAIYNVDSVKLNVGKYAMVVDVTPSDDSQEEFLAMMADTNNNIGSIEDDVFALKYVQWLIERSVAESESEFEDADWQGIYDPNGAAEDPLIKKMDGYRKQCADLAQDGNATVVVTGAINQGNAVEKVETHWRGFDKLARLEGTVTFCSFKTFDDFKINYRERNNGRELGVTTYENTNYEAAKLYLGGGKSYLMPVPGIGDDDVLIGLNPKYLGIGYANLGAWDVQKRDFEVRALRALKYGVAPLDFGQGLLVVNDRLLEIEATRIV